MCKTETNANQILPLGVSADDFRALRRISMTLRGWYVHECNGAIQRDGVRGDGVPFWHSTWDGRRLYRAPDRERGALKRLETIMARYPALAHYVQGDPRGCALHLIPRDKIEGRDLDAIYSSRGYPVY
jgi:hypothetical protein